MKLFKILSVTLIMFSLFSLNAASAAATPTVQNTPSIKLVGTVGIKDARVISQNGNKFNIKFSITNGSIAQPSMKYGVRLVKTDGSRQSIVDEKVYDEILNLDANIKISKDIIYEAPTYLSGDYTLVLVGNAETGLTLTLNSTIKVKLTATSKSILFVVDSCSLKIKGETADKKYTLAQGVDVLPSESLSLNCLVENNTDTVQTVSPSLVTYYRSNYGNTVEVSGLNPALITLNKGEKKNVSIEISKPTKPQAYDVVVTLKNNEFTSNGVKAHYVLRGQSASIQNISLDKNIYKKDEISKVLVAWSKSADSFVGSRVKGNNNTDYFISISLTDGKGNKCAEDYKNALSSKDIVSEISLSIISSCVNPVLNVSINDKDGNVLDKREAKFNSPVALKNNILYVIAIILLLVLVVTLYYFKKKNNNSKTDLNIPSNLPVGVLFFFFILLSFVLPGGKIMAANFIVHNDSFGTDDLNVVVDLDQTAYEQNAIMYPSGSIQTLNCLNEYAHRLSETINISLTANNGGSPSSTATIISDSGSVNDIQSSYNATGSMTAPSDISSIYYALFTASISGPYGSASGTATIGYEVTGKPTITVFSDVSNVPSGGQATGIRWTSTNAKDCVCTFSPADNRDRTDCGSGIGTNVPSSPSAFTLRADTTFTVVCTN